MSEAEKSSTDQLRVNEKKWSRELMSVGWTVIPNVIFERQQALGLDPLDVNILLHLASYWWTPEGKPHPSKRTIATAIGVDPRTVQRRIAQLEAGGLIRREQRREVGKGSKSNIYHFDGLIDAAKPYALEKAEELEQRDAVRKARAGRKGKAKLTKPPALAIVGEA
jgi:predicted transcriptional regulator